MRKLVEQRCHDTTFLIWQVRKLVEGRCDRSSPAPSPFGDGTSAGAASEPGRVGRLLVFDEPLDPADATDEEEPPEREP
jgi:hypothetical protein